ncbi:MAG: radical SAM protein [Firmicutes bacterium]|nr:radical SAM protein [Bacillota bacterium]
MLNIYKIQRTCVHDGPGLRTTVFFQGCSLRCKWCQNPESLKTASETPSPYTLESALEIISRDSKYYIATTGGVTLSGGEPFLQDKESLLEFVKALKKQGYHISAETSLNAPFATIEALSKYIDLFLVDFKVIGNDEKHKELTGASNKLISENFDKLTQLKANIAVRMVVVPNFNDSDKDIENASEFFKEKGISSVELLRYHDMYLSKAYKLGLEVAKLDISPETAITALDNATQKFNALGIKAFAREAGARNEAKFSDRVISVRKAIRSAPRAVCMEVDLLKTKYYKKFKGFKKPVAIHRGERLKYVLQNKTIKVYPEELLVGNFTTKRVAGQVWAEQYGALYVTFIHQINRQKPVSFQCTAKEKSLFYRKLFPFWLKKGIIWRSHPSIKSLFQTIARTADRIAGFNNNFAAIAHYIVNFERFLERGTSGLIAEIEEKLKANPENTNYKGMIESLKGLEIFGERYAKLLNEEAEKEQDPIRKKELKTIATTCERVPKFPATNYREALQSMLLLMISLCLEAYENAVSLGRVDQILYPYYKKDIEAGLITKEEAEELLHLFVLKLDECVLVNDGEGFLSISQNFETLSTDQSITFGGVDKDGNDATNDITYMLISACELQPLAINMTARIHDNSPDEYIERLAQIYINGCPMPELFSDKEYIESLSRHYPKAGIENIRNYSIVGCVEPCCNDDHFGNTDCANMNLVLPFLQALKGQKYELWNYGFKEQAEKLYTHMIKYANRKKPNLNKIIAKREEKLRKRDIKRGRYIYNPPSTMEQLLADFQLRLNELAGGILGDQQRVERALQKYFVTPLASSLYRGCVESGKDAYEGGCEYNTAGIQAIGVTDVADSLYALNELCFKSGKYTLLEMIEAIDKNFVGEKNQAILKDILLIPKFGEDGENETVYWIDKVLDIYNKALDSCPYATRNGNYTAGYYALNVNDRYGKRTGAIPSGRLKGVPLANSVMPHYGMEESDLLSTLNSMAKVNYADFAVNGSTGTLHIDAALFPGEEGVKNLASIFKTYLTTGGMQLQPNVISKELLLEAYHNPDKHRYLMVRVAGYCAYFQELSDELKRIIVNRTCYS